MTIWHSSLRLLAFCHWHSLCIIVHNNFKSPATITQDFSLSVGCYRYLLYLLGSREEMKEKEKRTVKETKTGKQEFTERVIQHDEMKAASPKLDLLTRIESFPPTSDNVRGFGN